MTFALSCFLSYDILTKWLSKCIWGPLSLYILSWLKDALKVLDVLGLWGSSHSSYRFIDPKSEAFSLFPNVYLLDLKPSFITLSFLFKGVISQFSANLFCDSLHFRQVMRDGQFQEVLITADHKYWVVYISCRSSLFQVDFTKLCLPSMV